MTAAMRLDRLLSNLGYGSRREIGGMAKAGRIALDGAPLADASRKVALAPDLPDRLTVAGQRLDPLPGLVILLNKPFGVTCSHKEAGALVYELLPPRWRRREPPISTAGRLDKETSGLLLLTDDGGLLHRIISPKGHVPKRYRARLAQPLRGDEAAVFASGGLMLEGDDKPLLPARLEVVTPTEALVTITEGRYHQVRRMFAAVGNAIVELHREAVGGLPLPPDLPAGQWRLLSAAEVERVFSA